MEPFTSKISDDTEKVLKLLALIIIADGHIYDSEIKAFKECVSSIPLLDIKHKPLPSSYLHQWFTNQTNALNALANDNKNIEIIRLIISLAERADKQSILKALEQISRADGSLHMEEKRLISFVRVFWQFEDLDAPNIDIKS